MEIFYFKWPFQSYNQNQKEVDVFLSASSSEARTSRDHFLCVCVPTFTNCGVARMTIFQKVKS